MNVYIEVHSEGQIRHRWKIPITQPTGSWQYRAFMREQQVQVFIDHLRQHVMPTLPYAEFYIIFESKLNYDET